MYKVTVTVAAAALMASVGVAAQGYAKVINGCKYPISVCNVPSDDGIHTAYDTTLAKKGDEGDSYEQQFTKLENLMGWSIKVAKENAGSASTVLQFEYTYLPADPGNRIWFDLSEVNGNPWDGDWEISSKEGCKPKQAAYRYSTDDAYGMQDCPVNSNITLVVCSGEGQNDGLASSLSASQDGSEASPSTEATPPLPSPHHSHSHGSGPLGEHDFTHAAKVQTSAAVSPTTLATKTTEAPGGNIVTEYATAVVTEVVTATAYGKRDPQEHQHHHRHAHHPHARRV